MAKNVFSVYPAFADSDIAGTACTAPRLYITAYGVAFRHTVISHTAGICATICILKIFLLDCAVVEHHVYVDLKHTVCQ